MSAGMSEALRVGYARLEGGGTAVDAVEAAVAVMEDDDTFDAGRGSFLTRDGKVQMDALLMDGATLRTGGVACVERLRNPIHAARLVLDQSPHVYFVGAGAERFARQHGMALCDNMDLVIPREQRRLYAAQAAELAGEGDTTFSGPVNGPLASHDTVGAVARDAAGNLAAATSTGGTLNKAPGRVGDSSLIGLRLLRRQPLGGGVADGLGRTHYEARARQVGGGPRGGGIVAGGSCDGGDRVSLRPARRTRRDHPAGAERARRLRAQHAAHGLGACRRRRARCSASPVTRC